MKKFLISASLLITLPVFSACPVDGTTEACSLADAIKFPSSNVDKGFDTNVGNKTTGVLRVPNVSKQKVSKSYTSRFNQTDDSEKNYKEQTPLRTYRNTRNDYSYNADCQFGACNQTGTPQLFQQRND